MSRTITDATFSIPGSGGATPATVAGFGVIFTDVHLADRTSLEFFDINDNPMQTVFPTQGTVEDCSWSFVGAQMPESESRACESP